MSNCYASYCTRIPYWTQEQKHWLENATDYHDVLTDALESNINWDWDPESEGNGEWNFGQVEWEEPAKKSEIGTLLGPKDPSILGYVKIYDCEAASADVAFLALVYNNTFHCLDDRGWVMQVAFTDDCEGEDSFAGCSYAIYKGQTHYISTYDYEQFFEEQDINEAAIDAWQAALDTVTPEEIAETKEEQRLVQNYQQWALGYQEDGEVEVDPNPSVSLDMKDKYGAKYGAYVAAWIWVDNPEYEEEDA